MSSGHHNHQEIGFDGSMYYDIDSQENMERMKKEAWKHKEDVEMKSKQYKKIH